MISNRYAKCQVHHLFFFSEILFRGTPSRAANRSRGKQPRSTDGKQPRSTDRELRSSSFPFAVPISRSISSRSPYQSSSVGHQFVVVQVRPLAPVPISIVSWRRRTRDASPIARSDGGAKGNRAKGRKKPAWWNREICIAGLL